MGRPSSFTQEVADLICERLAEGESLRTICLGEEMPNRATVFRWLSAIEQFRDQYAYAREAQGDALFDEILDIADDKSKDTVYGDSGERPNAEWITRSKLRVEARKWMAGKLRPKVYGEKQEIQHTGNLFDSLLAAVDGSSLKVVPDE